MRAAATFLIERGQTEGLREIVERFRNKADFGVWTRVTSSRLHQMNGDFAEGLAEIEDLMARFPKRAGAHWFVAQARCLAGLGRYAEAEAAAREGLAQFPQAALVRVFLANLLSRRKRHAEALAIWKDLIAGAEPPGGGLVRQRLGRAKSARASRRGLRDAGELRRASSR